LRATRQRRRAAFTNHVKQNRGLLRKNREFIRRTVDNSDARHRALRDDGIDSVDGQAVAEPEQPAVRLRFERHADPRCRFERHADPRSVH